MSENRCVICGDIIPEGRQVCPTCESGHRVNRDVPERERQSPDHSQKSEGKPS